MEPVIEFDGVRVFHGDCREVLAGLPENSVDSIVTDPPYGIEFMGREWDSFKERRDAEQPGKKSGQTRFWSSDESSGIGVGGPRFGTQGIRERRAFEQFSYEWAVECFRVLKPGGHLLAFGGTRMWHRLAVGIEDAGFEIRDNIAWIYGSGFPKSLDVSKAIDKGQGDNRSRQLRFVDWMRSTGLKASEINEAIGKADVGSHYLRHDQPAIATADLFDKLRPHLPPVPEEIERLVAERSGISWPDYVKREVIGSKMSGIANSEEGPRHTIGASKAVKVAITSAHSPDAEKWEGWGTALKPAHEPIVVGRKPLGGRTVAQNVLEWGVGGLNIDGSRIGPNPGYKYNTNKNGTTFHGKQGERIRQTADKAGRDSFESTQGRWPANVVFDEFTAGLLDEQSGATKSAKPSATVKYGQHEDTGKNRVLGAGLSSSTPNRAPLGDSGGASRFFYVAKASKRDRNEGLERLEAQRHADRVADDGPGGENPRNRTNTAKQNFHPTVKPTNLMRYLIKLVTPPGGTVLDPFTGSGSTGKAALLDGFQFVGIELTDDYLPIIEGRLKWASEQVETDDTLF